MKLIDTDKFLKRLISPKSVEALGRDMANWIALLVAQELKTQRVTDHERHGHWIINEDNPFIRKCSECGQKYFDAALTIIEFKYCPACGCRIEEVNDETK